MTRHQKPEPPRIIHPGGLSHREERTRMECLRLAADAGGPSKQIISRAQVMTRHVEAATTELGRATRWTCLRLASEMEHPPESEADIIRIANEFEDFIYGTGNRTSA